MEANVGDKMAKIEGKLVSVAFLAQKLGISGALVRRYCAEGRIFGAVQQGARRWWWAPKNSVKPPRKNAKKAKAKEKSAPETNRTTG